MKRLLFVCFVALAVIGPASQAQELPADNVAHGAEEAAHEIAHPEEEGHGAERTYFGIPGWILKLVNMILFLGVLGWLLRDPIARAFGVRRESIRHRLSEAEQRRERAERMSEEIQQRLARVEGEIEAIRARADEEGRRQSEQILESSQLEAEKILAAARGEIDQRLSQARRQLREYAAELATERATSLVESSISDRDRAAIFDQSVERIREAKS